MTNSKIISLMLSGALGFLMTAGSAQAVHQDVTLKDATGNAIAVGSKTPYSPKKTCGTCHDYESGATTVSKQQLVGGVSNAAYAVPVPTHGVSNGYHFQQGRNLAWGDTQRNFYALPGFTSSPGMYGKF